jgi:predicted cupin superfamily sugar epimerase
LPRPRKNATVVCLIETCHRKTMQNGQISAFILHAYVVLSIHIAVLRGIRKSLFAIGFTLRIGLWRQTVVPAAVLWLLTRLLGTGIKDIWWGI